ncbi:MAG: 3-hydroxyacyl-ACP dehydratase [Flavobacteriales bacterium]|nr:3-hydroxyacyl-ACP dehydratase [Flavobacteriales bacterium]
MLINDFFTITELKNIDGTINATIKLNASHKIFDGHFPENPITPGVVQIQIIKELLDKVLERECTLKEIGRCKFLAILNPNEDGEVDITIKHSQEDDVLKISAQGSSTDKNTTFFKFSAKYA